MVRFWDIEVNFLSNFVKSIRLIVWKQLYLVMLLGPSIASAAGVTVMIDPSTREREVYERLAESFNAANPDIRFRIIWTNLSDKMHLLTAADALPDLIPLPDFTLVNYEHSFLDLDPFLSRDPAKTEQIFPQLLSACRYEGRLKMMPTFFNVPLLYYRPDLFRAAGVTEPTSQWTWDDLRAAAKRLTVRTPQGRTEIWGTRVELGWWVEWLAYIRQAGSDLMDEQGNVTIGNPATRDGIRFMHRLIHEDQSAPLPREAPPSGFIGGRYATICGGHVLEWITLREANAFEWDIAPLPAGPAGRTTGEFAVAGYAIWNKARDPEAAWKVLSYLTDKEAGLALCRAGFPPVRKDVAAEEYLKGTRATRTQYPRNREALLETLTFARSVPKQKSFRPIAMGIVNPLIQAAVLDPNPASIDNIHTRLQRDCTGFLETMREQPTATVKAGSLAWGAAAIVVVLGTLIFLRRRSAGVYERPRAGTEKRFYLFISPWIVGTLLLTVGPMITSLYWSLTSYDLTSAPRFIGIANYTALFNQDPYFWHSLRITLIYAAAAAPLSLVMGLVTAMLLNRNTRGMGVFRTLFYLPSILPIAASGLMWAWVFNPQFGMLNRALSMLGIPGPGWLYDPEWALPSLVIISLWGFGGGMLICLAGLKAIPSTLYEAAAIDGAGAIRQFIHVTLPSLSPVLFFNLTMSMIGALQIFDVAYIVGTVGPGLGEPQKSTYFYVLNLYEKSFIHLQLGLGSAMAWVLFTLILVLTLANFGMKRFWVHSEADTR